MLENRVNQMDEPRTLGELKHAGGTLTKPYAVLCGENMANNTLLLCLPAKTFHEISEVASPKNIAEMNKHHNNGNDPLKTVDESISQRDLDRGHARKLAQYILKGFIVSTIRWYEENDKTKAPELLSKMLHSLGKQSYMSLQPITANLRNCKAGGNNLRIDQVQGQTRVWFGERDLLWVIDGQHRRCAMDMVFTFLRSIIRSKRFPKTASLLPLISDLLTEDDMEVIKKIYEVTRTCATVAVELHLGLSVEQERQLFYDLNALSKPVSRTLVVAFNQTNAFETFIKNEILPILTLPVELKGKKTKEGLDLAAVMKISSIICFGKPKYDDEVSDQYGKELLQQFFEMLSGHPEASKKESLLVHTAFLFQLAAFISLQSTQSEKLEMIAAIQKSSFIKSLDKWKPSTEALQEDERAAYQSSFDKRGAYKQIRTHLVTQRLIKSNVNKY